jgi:hypothetical protein
MNIYNPLVPSQPCGGVAIIFRTALCGQQLAFPFCPTMFECLCVILFGQTLHLVVASIYRPGSTGLSAQFHDELMRLLNT